MQTHFLQTPAWNKLLQLERKTTFHLQTTDFEALVTLEPTPLGSYLYCPYGPTLKEPTVKCLQLALDALKQLAHEQNAFFVRIEPITPFSADDLRKLHLVKSHDLDPAHTWVLDLSSPRDELLRAMQTSNRQRWKSHQKKGLSIRFTKDPAEISILTSLLAQVGQQNHFNPQSETHLRHQLEAGFAKLYVVDYLPPDQSTDQPTNQSASQTANQAANQPIPIAASLIYDTPTTRYYAHAAASNAPEYRRFNAATVLLVQMIVDAQSQGQKSFDFWGITTSDNPKHPWYGFTQYKKSFGGATVDYSGTWDLPFQPTRYHLYQLIRHLNRLKRKIHK